MNNLLINMLQTQNDTKRKSPFMTIKICANPSIIFSPRRFFCSHRELRRVGKEANCSSAKTQDLFFLLRTVPLSQILHLLFKTHFGFTLTFMGNFFHFILVQFKKLCENISTCLNNWQILCKRHEFHYCCSTRASPLESWICSINVDYEQRDVLSVAFLMLTPF